MGECQIILDDEDWKKLPTHVALRHSSSKSENQLQEQSQQQKWSMVVIRDCLPNHDDDLSIFPPIHHENLHVLSSSSSSSSSSSLWCTQTQHSPSPSYPTFLFAAPDSDHDPQFSSIPSDSMVPVVGDGVNGWWNVLRLKMLNIVSWFLGCKRGRSRRTFWSSYPAIGVAALVLWWWVCARVRRRRRKRESVDRLKLMIKEKDEVCFYHCLVKIFNLNMVLRCL